MRYMYNKMAGQRSHYARLKEGTRVADCVQCKQCEDYCPQEIKISERGIKPKRAVAGFDVPQATALMGDSVRCDHFRNIGIMHWFGGHF